MRTLPIASILIPEDRQRKSIDPAPLLELVESIESPKGLLHAIVLQDDGKTLVAGERRLRAAAYIYEFGGTFTHDGEVVPPGEIPYTLLSSLSPSEIEEAELEENIRRSPLSWQEEAAAVARLASIRQRLHEEGKVEAPPSFESLAADTDRTPAHVRSQIILAANLSDPDVAGATSVREAHKILQRKERASRSADLANEIGKTFTASSHVILNEDCEAWTAAQPDGLYDVILTDPPYGMGADAFGDSGGLAAGAHAYKDDEDALALAMRVMLAHSFRLAKPAAHLYLFCDIDHFATWRLLLTKAGWDVFRTPLIWHKPGGMRTPWVNGGPQRRFELIVYARKGDRPVTKISGDVISCPTDDNLGHSAQKPVALFEELLSRSVCPGDRVLDLFAGSGPVIPAAHSLLCQATAVEKDSTSYGICLERARGLLPHQSSLLV